MNKRVAGRVIEILQLMRIMFYRFLSTGHSVGRVTQMQPALVLGDGIVEYKDGVIIGYFPFPYYLNGYIHLEARGKHSSIIVGENTHLNNNFVAIAEHTSIRIGKRCLFGVNVEILDSDFHGLKVSERGISVFEKAKPVVIEDDVFVGSYVRIMKGVVIGSGSVIANGSIVVNAIPPGVVAGGNPARVLRAIEG
jgi:acetyltransferase-like isoleucine patch superfamily enzyme